MHLVAIAWIYVVFMMAVAEATSSTGSLLGAFITFVFYGVVPLGIVLYVMASPKRRQLRRAAEARAEAQAGSAAMPSAAAASTDAAAGMPDPHRGHHAAGDAIAPERKKP